MLLFIFFTENTETVSKALVGTFFANGMFLENDTKRKFTQNIRCEMLSIGNLECVMDNFIEDGRPTGKEDEMYLTVQGNSVILHDADSREENMKGTCEMCKGVNKKVNWIDAGIIKEYSWTKSGIFCVLYPLG